jgi:hypothetical protein
METDSPEAAAYKGELVALTNEWERLAQFRKSHQRKARAHLRRAMQELKAAVDIRQAERTQRDRLRGLVRAMAGRLEGIDPPPAIAEPVDA